MVFRHWFSVAFSLVAVASITSAAGAEDHAFVKSKMPGTIFSSPLPDVPGKNIVVVALDFPPATKPQRVDHRHPGSVYVYVTKGSMRLGIEGEPVKLVRAGESFFEPPNALHTVAESASATESASAIAVMIVSEGAPLVTADDPKGHDSHAR